MPDVNNVTAGKPATIGSIYWAPLGTTLPTNATTVLDEAFVNLGYVSDAGVTNDNSQETDNVKDWGGNVVLSTETDYTDTYQFTLIEAKNVDVLKFVYGADNVEGTLETGITVKANNKEKPAGCLVIDMLYRNGVLKRDVIPNGKITDRGETSYNSSDPVGFETTVGCMNDAAGNSHYEYIQAPGA